MKRGRKKLTIEQIDKKIREYTLTMENIKAERRACKEYENTLSKRINGIRNHINTYKNKKSQVN